MKKLISIYTLFLLLTVAICAHAGTVNYTYDNAGRLTKADYGDGKSITYTYDNAGNLLSRVIVGQTHTLTVTKSGTGSGTVTSSPAGIDCGTDCNEDYDHGTAVTLTATPDAGSTFTGWSGDTSDGQVTMDADKNVTAEFSKCKAESIAANPGSLELKRWASGNVTVTVTDNDGCPVKDKNVKALISEKGKELIKILPKEADTNENGEATFTITAKRKTGKTTVIFKAGTLIAKVRVKVTK